MKKFILCDRRWQSIPIYFMARGDWANWSSDRHEAKRLSKSEVDNEMELNSNGGKARYWVERVEE